MPQSIFEATSNTKMANAPSQAPPRVKASLRTTKHDLATAVPRRTLTRLVASIRSWRARLNRLKPVFRAPGEGDADDRIPISPMSSPKIRPKIPVITITPCRADMTARMEEREVGDEEDAPVPTVHAVVEEQLAVLIEEVFWDAEEDLEIVELSPRVSFDDDDEAQDFAWAGDELEDFRLFVTAASYGWI